MKNIKYNYKLIQNFNCTLTNITITNLKAFT